MGEGANRSHACTGISRPARPGAILPAILAICSLIGFARQAEALSLLVIRDFSQSIGLSYSFNRSSISQGGNFSETDHEFTEDYGINFHYSLLDPRLLKGNAMLDLEGLQRSADTNGTTRGSTDLRLRYNVSAQLLSRSSSPVNLAATSTRQTVSQSFAPSYDSVTDGLSARLALLNSFVPANISVERQTQETSGFGQNFRQTANSLSIAAAPSLGKIGSLNLGSTWTDSSATALDSNLTTNYSSVTARAGGQSGWHSKRGLARLFSATYNYQGTAGTTPLTNQNLNGNLYWQLGKALDGSLQYFDSRSRSDLFTTESQGSVLSLTHRLFDSLTTGLNLSVAENRFNSGTNRVLAGGAKLAYHKLLPESSNLNLSYAYGLSLNERTGDVSVVTVLNEQQPIPTTLPRRISLAHPTFQPAGIQVVGAQSLLPYPASYFTIIPEGIEIANFFAGDTAVLISYSYRQDPSVTTMAVSHGITSSLSLYQGKYLLYADAFMSDQNQVKGEATSLTLTNTRHIDVGATAKLARQKLGAEVGYDKSYIQDLYYLSSSWQYAAPFAAGDISMTASDRYTWQSLSQHGGQADFWTNSFNVTSEYRRPIGFLAGRFKADYANTLITGGTMFHTALLSVNIEGRFGKLYALLTSTATWSLSDKGTSSSQGFGVSLRRVF
jgi:hypothetical protein